MFDHRAEGHIAHGLASQIELRHETLQGRRHQILVGAIPVDGM
jgi:hypothetical protein